MKIHTNKLTLVDWNEIQWSPIKFYFTDLKLLKITETSKKILENVQKLPEVTKITLLPHLFFFLIYLFSLIQKINFCLFLLYDQRTLFAYKSYNFFTWLFSEKSL